MASQQLSGRAASMARRQQQVNGKGRSAAAPQPTRQPDRKERVSTPVANTTSAPAYAAAPAVSPSFTAQMPANLPRLQPAQKSASRLRREALATRGKVADTSRDRQRTQEMVRATKPVAETKTEYCCDECRQDKVCASETTPSLPTFVPAATSSSSVAKKKAVVSASSAGRMLSRARRTAMSGRGKAGLDAHGKGNATAALARQANPEISTRDIARVVRDARSKGGARSNNSASPARARRPRNAAEAKQANGTKVSGTKVGHTEKLTGDEVGLCHTGITGTQYMAAEIFEKFCQVEAPKAPKKVLTTETLTGNTVTVGGGKVGSNDKLTGVDRGACRDVTGSEYLGQEHFAGMCKTVPPAAPAKISTSRTQRGIVISGPKPSAAEHVTGNERGECRAVTGTPYLGQEQFESFCSTEDQRANRRLGVMPRKGNGARDISGTQPALTGKEMTGTEKGACQLVSGTPYIAESELIAVCSSDAAEFGAADFPQLLGEAEVVGEFSVIPSVVSAPAVKSAPATVAEAPKRKVVTGAGYEDAGSVTGAFSMGKGKVTGTEQARFGSRTANAVESKVKPENEPQVAARITGEGIDVGLRITGDDWDRGNRVTGTEGGAAMRNPTRRGPMTAMPGVEQKRDPQRERPSAPVTGGSGGSEGSKVTVSGGARG